VFLAAAGPGRRQPKLALDALPLIARRLAEVPARAERTGDPAAQIVFLGDSMLLARAETGAVPEQVERLVDAAPRPARRVAVHAVAIPGSGPFDYYFAGDEILQREPDLVVIAFNLTTLSDTWRIAFARPQLAGLLSPRRIPEAVTLPLHWAGLTTDRMLSYIGLVRIGALGVWTELAGDQARVSHVPDRLSRRLARWAGTNAEERFERRRFLRNARHRPGTDRFDAVRERERFGAALSGVAPDHPVLRALGAAVRIFARESIPVFVYVSPANVENLAETGILDRAGLATTLQSIERVVVRANGRYADLHDLLPDGGFSDPAGHFSRGGDVDGTLRVAREIAAVVAEETAQLPVRR